MLTLAEHNERVARLADHELIEALQRVLSQERGTHARLLVHLAEVDARGLYRERAYGSMFDYCVQAFHMSEAEAYLRIRAARLGREFPRVLLMLEAGELNLSTIKLLAPVLSKHDADQWLPHRRARVVGTRAASTDESRTLARAKVRAQSSALRAAVYGVSRYQAAPRAARSCALQAAVDRGAAAP
jgi:hypothetical protein